MAIAPSLSALFFLKVELFTVKEPLVHIALPVVAEFSMNVEFIMLPLPLCIL